ncbi:unnamed protein product [Rhizophagus irregularis]|nr:unnamed protein product [Rhizophagus irregularis]
MIINISLSSFFLGFFGFLEVTGSLSILESPWIWRSINENLIGNNRFTLGLQVSWTQDFSDNLSLFGSGCVELDGQISRQILIV